MRDRDALKLNLGRSKAILLLVITAILWSTGGLLIKLVHLNPLAIAGMRSVIASAVLLLVLRKPKFTWSTAQIGAALSYTGLVILFVSANKMTTAANAILLQFTAPIYVALFGAWFLKEKTRLFDWITIFIVLGGMALFFLDHLSTQGLLGNIAAIASGLSFALFTLFMRMQKDSSPLESVLLGNILTAIIGIPFMFQSTLDTTGLLSLILLGVVQLGIPYILYSIAIKHVTAIEAVLIPVIEPILNPIWVFLVFNESPGPWAFKGGFIVLIAVTLRLVLPVVWAKKTESHTSQNDSF